MVDFFPRPPCHNMVSSLAYADLRANSRPFVDLRVDLADQLCLRRLIFPFSSIDDGCL